MATKTPIVIPDGVDAEGSLLLLWVPTLANPTKPTYAELTADGVVDITYRELDERSTQLARVLIDRGIGVEDQLPDFDPAQAVTYTEISGFVQRCALPYGAVAGRRG